MDKSITDTYIASTTDEFVKRKSARKSSCNNPKNRYHNLFSDEFSRTNGGWENFEMIQIEEHPCNNKRELEFREEKIKIESMYLIFKFSSCKFFMFLSEDANLTMTVSVILVAL